MKGFNYHSLRWQNNASYDTFLLDPAPDVPICPSVDNCLFNCYNVSVMHNCSMHFRRHWCIASTFSCIQLYKPNTIRDPLILNRSPCSLNFEVFKTNTFLPNKICVINLFDILSTCNFLWATEHMAQMANGSLRAWRLNNQGLPGIKFENHWLFYGS